MLRVRTYVALQQVASADLNAIQDNALGIAQAPYMFCGERPTLQATSATPGTVAVGQCYGAIVNGVAVGLTGSFGIVTSALAASTWYYVYGYISSGALVYEYNTSIPDVSLSSKQSDPTRVYIGCFRTDTAAQPIPFTMRNRRYLYRNSSAVATPVNITQVYSTATLTPGALTAFRLSPGASGSVPALLPPSSYRAQLRLELTMSNTAANNNNFFALVTNGDPYSPTSGGTVPPTNGTTSTWWVPKGASLARASTVPAVHDRIEIITDFSQDLAYYVDNTDASSVVPVVSLWVDGFTE